MSSTVTRAATRTVTRAATCTTRSVQPRLHLTRRGRIVLTVLVSTPLVIAAFFGITNGGTASASSDSGSSSLRYFTVAPGDTLWQLASELVPRADLRDVVAEIVQLNQLNSGDIQAGQRLAIPAKYSR